MLARTVSLLVLTLCACGGEKAKAAPPGPGASVRSSATAIERFFPLEDGKIYQYATRDGAEQGILVAKVRRTDASRGELRVSNATKRFIYAADGVAYATGVYILKTPLEVGTSWAGEHGGTTKIASVDTTVKVPAGTYASCVQTVEEGGRPAGSRYTNTYCPGVGLVALTVVASTGEASAELKSYGAPILIEGTGVTAIPVGP